MFLSDIIIILSRPAEPGNIGAVCRAMKNMGLSRLRIAGLSREDLAGEAGQIRARAVHAADIWEGAAFFDGLSAAAADCSFLAGSTRRRGQRRKNLSLDPAETAGWFRERPGPAALVFGNERTGLDDRELALCNIATHIPSSPSFPSLNLSHAVQIYAYELFRALGQPDGRAPDPVKGAWIPLSRTEADTLSASISASLESLGFYRHPGQEEQTVFLRDLISRAALGRGEGRYLEGIFAKAAALAKKARP
ncbi:MAG: RNA methyltransferase [Treponema sp.]|jgi:tRNA/rRNA methyltransferase/tRNA (cytidine32/uridine32-2'-O)-methyltransferase|nr:RNA methyltransferase [Treponema sp.]